MKAPLTPDELAEIEARCRLFPNNGRSIREMELIVLGNAVTDVPRLCESHRALMEALDAEREKSQGLEKVVQAFLNGVDTYNAPSDEEFRDVFWPVCQAANKLIARYKETP